MTAEAEQADAAKKRGAAHFLKKTTEGYQQALAEYSAAIELTPSNHLLYANRSACYAGLATKEWKPREKVLLWAKALAEANTCAALDSTWAKGYLRVATAQLELAAAAELWRKRKAEDLDWNRERKAAEAVPKASGGGGGAFSDEEEVPTEVESDKARAERIATMEAQSGARSMTPSDSSNGSKGLPEDKVDDPYWKGEEDVDAPLPPEFATLVTGATHCACEAACRAGLELDPASVPLREKLQELRDAGHATDHDADKASGDPTSSESLKTDGNAKFQNKRFKEAVVAYTRALSFDPCNHVLYSNRSACYAELGDEEAGKCLADAERCVALAPSFAKGYSRKGFALYQLGRYVEAEACAEAGLQLDSTVPVAKGLLDLHTKCKLETKESPEFQKQIHQLRLNKRRDAKMQQLLQTLNVGGMGGVQMFNGMNTDLLGGLLSGGAGAGAMNGGGGGGTGGANMTEAQMRQMAHAMSSGASVVPSSAAVPVGADAPARAAATRAAPAFVSPEAAAKAAAGVSLPTSAAAKNAS